MHSSTHCGVRTSTSRSAAGSRASAALDAFARFTAVLKGSESSGTSAGQMRCVSWRRERESRRGVMSAQHGCCSRVCDERAPGPGCGSS